MREYQDLLSCINEEVEGKLGTTVTASDESSKSTDHDDDSITSSDKSQHNQEHDDGTSVATHPHELLIDPEIIRRIIDHATSYNVTIKLADPQKRTSKESSQHDNRKERLDIP